VLLAAAKEDRNSGVRHALFHRFCFVHAVIVMALSLYDSTFPVHLESMRGLAAG
jgi:hypothetical protein